METISQSLVLDHWPFFVVALLLGIVGSVVKSVVIPPKAAKPKAGWRALYRTTLPLHPAAAGGLLGLFPFMPCPADFCTDTASRVLYYVAAGMLSSYVYAAVKHMARAQLGDQTPE